MPSAYVQRVSVGAVVTAAILAVLVAGLAFWLHSSGSDAARRIQDCMTDPFCGPAPGASPLEDQLSWAQARQKMGVAGFVFAGVVLLSGFIPHPHHAASGLADNPIAVAVGLPLATRRKACVVAGWFLALGGLALAVFSLALGLPGVALLMLAGGALGGGLCAWSVVRLRRMEQAEAAPPPPAPAAPVPAPVPARAAPWSDPAVAILRERFARGEISEDEYARRRAALDA